MQLESLEIRMARSENLPALPQAASNVLRLADDVDVSPREIERAIELDPAITAKLLKVANSAYYGNMQVSTLGRAIGFLGLTTVRSVVVSIAMQQMISGKSLCPEFNKVDFWKHSLAVATTSRIIGKMKMAGKAEELFCAGMMHEIGFLALEKFAPDELRNAIKRSKESRLPIEDAVEQVFSFSIADVGSLLVATWNISPVIQDAIRFVHTPHMSEDHSATTDVVALSDAIANKIGFVHNGTEIPETIDPQLVKVVGIPEEQIEIICQVVAQEIARTQETFQIAA
ncbi:MAG: HDOD domain-containing protein [Armatimonadetes bacterium]|nr:HDOD domain-containing protein [Armatimonadota bacterium]